MGHPGAGVGQQFLIRLGQDHRVVRQQPLIKQTQAVQVGHRGGAVPFLAVLNLPLSLRQVDNQAAIITRSQLAALLQQLRRAGIDRVGLDGHAHPGDPARRGTAPR